MSHSIEPMNALMKADQISGRYFQIKLSNSEARNGAGMTPYHYYCLQYVEVICY